jgi:hypothetical protein
MYSAIASKEWLDSKGKPCTEEPPMIIPRKVLGPFSNIKKFGVYAF